MKNIGVKVLITNLIIWNSKQTPNKQKTSNNKYVQPTLKLEKKTYDKNTKTKTSPSQPLKSSTTARGRE